MRVASERLDSRTEALNAHLLRSFVLVRQSLAARAIRVYPKSIVKAPVSTILVPRPQTAVVGGKPIAGIALLEWARGVIDTLIDPPGTQQPGHS